MSGRFLQAACRSTMVLNLTNARDAFFSTEFTPKICCKDHSAKARCMPMVLAFLCSLQLVGLASPTLMTHHFQIGYSHWSSRSSSTNGSNPVQISKTSDPVQPNPIQIQSRPDSLQSNKITDPNFLQLVSGDMAYLQHLAASR